MDEIDWMQVQGTQTIRVTEKITITKLSDATIIFTLPHVLRTRKLDKPVELQPGNYLIILMKNGLFGIYSLTSIEPLKGELLYTRQLLPS